MLKIFLFSLLLQVTALANTSAFLSVPDMSALMEYPQDVNPEWPLELVEIQKEVYKRNEKASFCMRPVEMVDTLVIHHSETPATTTAQEINDFHLARGTPEDPWYMIAYSYVINSPYARTDLPLQKVTEGRPLEIVGAHAGTNAFVPMDEEQKRLWDANKVLCGKENEEPKLEQSLVIDGKIKANVTTIGIVINGNYSPFSITNPSGYSKKKPRYPTMKTQDLVAKLSCQLQKKYPRIKVIKWHSYYHDTTCPGTIKSYIGQIKTLAKRYGCEFN